jgi:hypothetical protein
MIKGDKGMTETRKRKGIKEWGKMMEDNIKLWERNTEGTEGDKVIKWSNGQE